MIFSDVYEELCNMGTDWYATFRDMRSDMYMYATFSDIFIDVHVDLYAVFLVYNIQRLTYRYVCNI